MFKALIFAALAATITPGTQDLYSGTRKLSTHPDLPACVAAAKARGVSANYTCRTRTGVVVAVTVDPPPPLPPIDCVVSDAAVTSDWSACSNGVQTRSTTWSRNVVTQPANGGAACPKLADPVSESRSCSVDPPPTVTEGLVLDTFDTVKTVGNHPLWVHYSEDGGKGSTKISAACARVGGSGLQYDVTAGRAYLDFYSNDGGGWRRASSFAPGYVSGKYNALAIWVKNPANFKPAADYVHNIELGTYIGPGSGSKQGDHYYHFYNLVPGLYSYVILDANPQHIVGGSKDPDVISNYIDNLGRFYWDQQELPSVAPATFCFDEPTFITIPADEDVANVASLEASYNPATKLLHVGFQRNRDADVAYTARWSLADFHTIGFAGGNACGVSSANRWGDYSGKQVECTVDLAGKPEVFIAVQKSGNTTYRQIRLALQ